ncbi:hypothetical protein EAH75_04550 [Rhodanobacter glycinis]|nr:hypothetical protein EAH75_04550 [Rhodanobacter glycinis]
MWRLRKPTSVSWKVATTDSTIEVCFGNLFDQDGIRLIPVNDYFDSKLGKPVAPKSLHGQLIERGFGGHPDAFDRSVDAELAKTSFSVITTAQGKDKVYPVGTTAMVEAAKERYLLFALAKSDPIDHKATADVPQMFVALAAAWHRARAESNGETVNVPLVGTGQSGVDLPTREALNALILSIITATKAKRVAGRIRIVLYDDRKDAVDLRDVKKYWSVQ